MAMISIVAVPVRQSYGLVIEYPTVRTEGSVISTSISHDLLKKIVFKDINDRVELLYARMAGVLAILVAGWFGINPPGFVAQVVAFAFGLAASSFFPVIILGIFSKRVNKQGAIAGMLTGLIFTSAYIIYFKGVFIEPMAENIPGNWLFGISPEGIGTLGMALNFIVTLTVSKFTPEPPENVQQMIENIRVPREMIP